MVCKNCGATVKDGQFTCSSCGAYLSKNSTVNASSLEERSMLSSDDVVYTKKLPVTVEEGWKWYMFMTYCIIPLWSLSNLAYVIKGYKESFILALLYLSIAILGFVAHKKLVNFSSDALIYVYIILFSPLYIIFYSYLKLKKLFGDYFNVGASLLKDNRFLGILIFFIIWGLVNAHYFYVRKYEFQD